MNPSERRHPKFTETLSLFMVRVAALGALLVLVDIKFTFTFASQIVTIGSGFSADLKGAIITAILISGWTAVKEYWLGASASGQNQAESMSRIAEASAPTAAAAVAAANAPIKTDEVKVEANSATVTTSTTPQKGPAP